MPHSGAGGELFKCDTMSSVGTSLIERGIVQNTQTKANVIDIIAQGSTRSRFHMLMMTFVVRNKLYRFAWAFWNKIHESTLDCVDGTDEPGTSACSAMDPSVQRGGQFWCPNNVTGSGKYITASRVHDGVCDCCNGADEMTLPGLVSVANFYN